MYTKGICSKQFIRGVTAVLTSFIIIPAFVLLHYSCNMDADAGHQASVGGGGSPDAPAADEWWKEEARKMVDNQIAGRGIEDPELLEVMRTTPRHRFVPDRYQRFAYSDQPLPIAHGQTISQPYIVALMTSHLSLTGDEKVLEIGTGSGYQAAILAPLVEEVYTIEIVEGLALSSQKLLEEMEYKNIHVLYGDGYQGWPEHAPFDRIIVTAAPPQIPPRLVEQLKPGGKMILPVGKNIQYLKAVYKDMDGSTREEVITGVRFVPMVHPEDVIPTDQE